MNDTALVYQEYFEDIVSTLYYSLAVQAIMLGLVVALLTFYMLRK